MTFRDLFVKMAKLTLRDLRNRKGKEKITYITAYDYPTARLAERAGIDMILVGDSAANNVLGYTSTNPISMNEMITFANAVRRGAPNTFIVGDMPFMTYQVSDEDAVRNAGRFIQEASMDAVKLEGGVRMTSRVKAINEAGIAVMGHIGYTPQSTNLETVVQAKSTDAYAALLRDAEALYNAGAFSILLEAVPEVAGESIARTLNIPIYGIGAGGKVDGILAIMHDVIGLGEFKSRFAKKFGDSSALISESISSYVNAIKSGEYPSKDQCYPLSSDPKIAAELEDQIRNYKPTKNN